MKTENLKNNNFKWQLRKLDKYIYIYNWNISKYIIIKSV